MSIPQDSAGNIGVALVPPTGTLSTQIQGTTAVGNALVANPVSVGAICNGVNGATAANQALLGSQGASLSVNTEGRQATYSACFAVTPAASATDIAMIIGSASKIVRLTRVAISGIATAVAVIDVVGIKRSAADTGGTITAQNITNHDSNDAVATAVCNAITVNATLGAQGSKYAGNVRFSKLGLQTAANLLGAAPQPLVWDFTNRNERSVVLRGIADAFCVNLNGVQSSGQVMDLEFTWTEE
jgi:hypothetical protein